MTAWDGTRRASDDVGRGGLATAALGGACERRVSDGVGVVRRVRNSEVRRRVECILRVCV